MPHERPHPVFVQKFGDVVLILGDCHPVTNTEHGKQIQECVMLQTRRSQMKKHLKTEENIWGTDSTSPSFCQNHKDTCASSKFRFASYFYLRDKSDDQVDVFLSHTFHNCSVVLNQINHSQAALDANSILKEKIVSSADLSGDVFVFSE